MALQASQRGREVMRALAKEGWNEGSLELDDPTSVVSAIRFLVQMSQSLEEHGNLHESVKSAESALFLRRANEEKNGKYLQPLITEGILQQKSVDEAGELVLRCNSYAVNAFNEKRFEAAEFFLSKALFLTDVRNKEEVNYFPASETRRLRLRAATLNNLGCMEKRRGRMEQSLSYLRQAVELEVSVDDNSCGSPSTYLNLCTVLNELGRHHEAVRSAESAVSAVEYQILEQNQDQVVGYAMMLVVGYYNLGVSLERRGREGDVAKAHLAYQRSLLASRKYIVEPDCPTVGMAVAAIRRMRNAPALRLDQKDDLSHFRRNRDFMLESNRPRELATHPGAGAAETPRPVAESAVSPHVASQTVTPREASLHAARLAPLVERPTHSSTPQSILSRPSNTSADIPPPVNIETAAQQKPSQPLVLSRERKDSKSVQDLGDTLVGPLRVAERGSSSRVSETSLHGRPPYVQKVSDPIPMRKGIVARAPEDLAFKRSLSPLPLGQLQQGQSEKALPAQRQSSGQSVSSKSSRHAPSTPHDATVPLKESASDSFSVFGEVKGLGGLPVSVIKRESLTSVSGQSVNVSRPFDSSKSLRSQQRWPSGEPQGAPAKRDSAMSRHFLKPLSSVAGSATESQQGEGLKPLPVTSLAALAESWQKGSFSKDIRISTSQTSNPFGRRMFEDISVQETRKNSQSLSKGLLEGLSGSESQALEKHMQRAKRRQSLKDARKKTDVRRGSALAKAKEREQKMIAREEAKYDASVAEMLYEKLVVGMRADELFRCNRAATRIQSMWRGCMARTLVIRMIAAARKIQKAFRVFLVSLLAARRLEMERLAHEKALLEKKQLEAITVLQARVRQFIRRLAIHRAYLALKMRRKHAARKIQRLYRDFLKRREAFLAALMEAQRLEDERQRQKEMNAASRIQWEFRRYLKRRDELRLAHELQRREQAASTIQALVRGVLARAWFGYYKLYRREQEFKSAANQKRVIQLQAAARVQLSVHVCRRREDILVRRLRLERLHKAAMKIQCMWRCRSAWIAAERLRAELGIKNRHATRIQRWLRTCITRRKFLEHLENKRREDAATQIQKWYWDAVARAKEREMQRYHVMEVRRRMRARVQYQSVMCLQAWWRSQISVLIVKSMRFSFLRLTLYAEDCQRIGRGYAGRRALCRYMYRLIRESKERVELRRQTAAACVIQRAWRCCVAKSAVEYLRMCAAASTQITKHYRGYLCRKELRRLREAKHMQKATRAAVTIQRAARHFLRRMELAHMERYYRERHQKKLALMRREEAAATLQAVWRGRATRAALERERKRLEALAVHVLPIQRAWRARIFRQKVNVEVSKRSAERMDRNRAALKLQCFWRKMAAAERVAKEREMNIIRQRAAIALQRRWRCVLAKRELEIRRSRREEERALETFYMDKWESMTTIVNATLRMRLAQGLLLARKRKQLLMQLTSAERTRFLQRHGAATKIQAMYRGYYERVYARWLRKERAEEERRRKEHEALENRCATKIQNVFRCWRSRRRATALRTAKREKHVNTVIEQYTSINPQELVQQIFWIHESVTRRDFAKERLESERKHERAALAIQKSVRRWLSKRRTEMIKLQAHQARTVKTIQTFWKRYRARVMQKELERKQKASIVIQRRFRGYIVRRDWEAFCRLRRLEHQQKVQKEEACHHAATVLQSFWRRIRSERHAEALLEERQRRKVNTFLSEAASCIQRAYRRYRKRCLLETMK